MSSSETAVSVRGLSKAYTIAHDQEKHITLAETILARLKNPLRRPTTETFWALKDVNFEIKKGEVVGVIGRNGAGKSTLLKVLSRITEPTAGEIDIFGRVGSLLEVGTGFHPELTGRENIFLNGAILGMSKPEIRGHFDAIVDFAGIEKFLDTPVKRYSSGMYVRLAFAVAAHLNSEILIVDEVLAVGDAAFQKKCIGKMSEVARGGRTVLFVSHNIAAIQNLCKTGILLRSGQVSATGTIEDVLNAYLLQSGNSSSFTLANRTDRSGNGKIKVERVEFNDMQGNSVSTVSPGEPFEVVITCRCKKNIERLELSVDLEATDGSRLTTLYSGFQAVAFPVAEGMATFRCRVNGLSLRPDTYPLHIWLGDQGGDRQVYDEVQRAAVLDVATKDFYGSGRIPERIYGPLMLKYTWSTNEVVSTQPQSGR